jgi:IclR family acetate operon transcriptional repressor
VTAKIHIARHFVLVFDKTYMEPPVDPATSAKPQPKRAAGKRPAAETAEHAFPTIKALAIIETLATARRPLGVTEISVLQGMPKPTAHRIVRMLENEGLLQREPGKRRFIPGARLMQLGLGIVSASMLCAPRHAILEALSNEVGETCNFGVMVGSQAIYLDRVESAWPLGLRFEAGSRVPLHCTAMGKLFLSLLPSRKRALLLRAIPLHRYTDNTIIDRSRLEHELDNIRASGISTDNQEFLAGVVCVAVPVNGPNAQPAAALAVSAPLARMSLEQALRHVPLLQAAAERLAGTIEDEDRNDKNEP